MPYKNKPRPYKKEYKQQKARGEHKARMERQRARRKLDKTGVDKNKKVKFGDDEKEPKKEFDKALDEDGDCSDSAIL